MIYIYKHISLCAFVFVMTLKPRVARYTSLCALKEGNLKVFGGAGGGHLPHLGWGLGIRVSV